MDGGVENLVSLAVGVSMGRGMCSQIQSSPVHFPPIQPPATDSVTSRDENGLHRTSEVIAADTPQVIPAHTIQRQQYIWGVQGVSLRLYTTSHTQHTLAQKGAIDFRHAHQDFG